MKKVLTTQRLFVILINIMFSCIITSASIVKGPFTFADDAFADTAKMVVGSINSFDGGATSVQGAICGSNLSTGFGIGEFNQGEVVEISFVDNVIYNGIGTDLVVFEHHAEDGFDVAVGLLGGVFSSFIHFEPVYQGFSEGGYQNASVINLDVFGLAESTVVNVIRIREDDYDSAELTGIGALNSIPEPTTIGLFGLSCLVLLTKRKT